MGKCGTQEQPPQLHFQIGSSPETSKQSLTTKAIQGESPERLVHMKVRFSRLHPGAGLLMLIQDNYPSFLNSIYSPVHIRHFPKHLRARTAHKDGIFFLEILSYVHVNEPTTQMANIP